MGEDRSGVFREIRFVTGVSRVTSDAGKPRGTDQQAARAKIFVSLRTNIARQNQKVIVGQSPVLVGIQKCLDIETISLRVLLLQDLQSLGMVQKLSVRGQKPSSVPVGDCHRDTCRRETVSQPVK